MKFWMNKKIKKRALNSVDHLSFEDENSFSSDIFLYLRLQVDISYRS